MEAAGVTIDPIGALRFAVVKPNVLKQSTF
jgi:hypothetical protein